MSESHEPAGSSRPDTVVTECIPGSSGQRRRILHRAYGCGLAIRRPVVLRRLRGLCPRPHSRAVRDQGQRYGQGDARRNGKSRPGKGLTGKGLTGRIADSALTRRFRFQSLQQHLQRRAAESPHVFQPVVVAGFDGARAPGRSADGEAGRACRRAVGAVGRPGGAGFRNAEGRIELPANLAGRDRSAPCCSPLRSSLLSGHGGGTGQPEPAFERGSAAHTGRRKACMRLQGPRKIEPGSQEIDREEERQCPMKSFATGLFW